MIVVIQDANILIDLADIGLLDAFFKLDVEAHTTDLVLHEVGDRIVPFVSRGHLQVQTLTADELLALVQMQTRERGKLSLPDRSVLQLAQAKRGVLLTGDGALRRTAKELQLEVHGVLWLLDQLVAQSILKPALAVKKLKRLMECNSRLPFDECQSRLKRWGSAR